MLMLLCIENNSGPHSHIQKKNGRIPNGYADFYAKAIRETLSANEMYSKFSRINSFTTITLINVLISTKIFMQKISIILKTPYSYTFKAKLQFILLSTVTFTYR